MTVLSAIDTIKFRADDASPESMIRQVDCSTNKIR